MPRHELTDQQRSQIDNTFRHHAPHGDQGQRYDDIRAKIRETAAYCCERTPQSAEQTLALRRLQEAMMYFNAAIAVNEAVTPAPAPRT